jgi:F-type H+-transporting ATPase subunit alpha
VVVSSTSDSAPLQYRPYSGCALAEYFMYEEGKDAVRVDDLSKQATAYRQMSWCRRRAARHTRATSSCAQPVARRAAEISMTQEDQVDFASRCPAVRSRPCRSSKRRPVTSRHIPTNVISITDRQIFLTTDLFFANVRPAVDVGISVSRVAAMRRSRR